MKFIADKQNIGRPFPHKNAYIVWDIYGLMVLLKLRCVNTHSPPVCSQPAPFFFCSELLVDLNRRMEKKEANDLHSAWQCTCLGLFFLETRGSEWIRATKLFHTVTSQGRAVTGGINICIGRLEWAAGGECAALCWLLCLLASEARRGFLSFKSFRRERRKKTKNRKKSANWCENTWTFTFGWKWAWGETLAPSAAVSEAVFMSACLLALAPYSWNSTDNHPTASQCQRLLASWNQRQRPRLQVALTNRGRRQKVWKIAASYLLLA